MLKKILEDLDFLENIPKGAKPNFSDKTFTSTNEWFSTFKRRCKYERGENGVIYVETLIDNISKYYKNLDNNSLKNLRDKLIYANLGLGNIIYTYKIDNQINVYENYLKSSERFEKIIKEIDYIIRSKNNFFNHCPKII